VLELNIKRLLPSQNSRKPGLLFLARDAAITTHDPMGKGREFNNL
jgi:hypothetical protein